VLGGKPVTAREIQSAERIHEIQRDLSDADRQAAIASSAGDTPASTEISSEEISSLFATENNESL
jgi:hypothetical protein